MKDHIVNIFYDCKELILKPHVRWHSIYNESISYQEFLRKFILPIIGLIGLATIVGDLLFASRFGIVFSYVLTHAMGEMAVYFFSVIGIAYVINELAAGFGINRNFDNVIRFVGHSMVPLFAVAIVTGLFPGLYLFVVFGFYSLYLFVIGIPYFFPALNKLPHNKKQNFIITALVLGILVFLLVFYLLSSILSV